MDPFGDSKVPCTMYQEAGVSDVDGLHGVPAQRVVGSVTILVHGPWPPPPIRVVSQQLGLIAITRNAQRLLLDAMYRVRHSG